MPANHIRAASRMAKPVRVVGWSKVSDYCITNGRHNVCKVIVNGREWYERWRVDVRPHVCEGRYMTAQEAKG